ncbi:MAG: hypothetical protein JO193_01650 [Candidatus Eremiobacteraeota bacterium]|nr:hypothetical protein [Candidatus Eremiobacteraeota bacterium]
MKLSRALVALIGLSSTVACSTTATAANASRMWHGCQIGNARDYYDTDITNAPIERNSRIRIASVVAAMDAQDALARISPSRGFSDDRGLYPINLAGPTTKDVLVVPRVAWHPHIPSPVPYDGSFRIESGADAHYFVVQKATAPACRDWEYYSVARVLDRSALHLVAYAGQVLDMATLQRIAGDGSPSVVGVNYLPSAITAEELDAASHGTPIRHVLNYVSQGYVMCNCFVYPAIPTVGDPYNKGAAANAYAADGLNRQLPEGARLRLHASYSDPHASTACRVVLNTLKHYGMFFRDSGSAYDDSNVINTLNYPNSSHSSNVDLHCLHNVHFTDFDVVRFARPVQAPPRE